MSSHNCTVTREAHNINAFIKNTFISKFQWSSIQFV